jgi:hypothetical protein
MSDKFDEELAASFIGMHLLIGITYVDAAEQPIEQEQLHGHILRINPNEGVVIALSGSGQEFCLPPDLSSFQAASPGEYRLRSTGEVVVDPDLTCTWVVKQPPH